MNEIFDKLKRVSVHNRQRIIEVIGLDTKYQQLLILKYCEGLSRDDLANRFNVSVDAIDKGITKARDLFTEIVQNEYGFFTKDQQELLGLIYKKVTE